MLRLQDSDGEDILAYLLGAYFVYFSLLQVIDVDTMSRFAH